MPVDRASVPVTGDHDKPLVEQALDLFVYVPLGMALEARDLLPKLAERGRGQVALTRLAGRMAAQAGRTGAGRVTGSRRSGDPAAERNVGAGGDDDLPIDGYDELSAPNILPVLEDLSGEELDELLEYEQAHRARATVINRIKQLQA